MSNLPPIPPDPISECRPWRDWLFRVGQVTGAGGAIAAAGTTNSYTLLSPISGFTTTIPSNVSTLVLNPARALQIGTVICPSTPSDGQEVTVVSSFAISTLNVLPNAGQFIINAPTTLQMSNTTPDSISGYCFKLKFIGSILTWIRMI